MNEQILDLELLEERLEMEALTLSSDASASGGSSTDSVNSSPCTICRCNW